MTKLGKILLYSLSLVPLYFLLIIQNLNFSTFNKFSIYWWDIKFYIQIISNNTISIFLFLLIIISYFTFKKLTSELNSRENLPKEFTNIKNIDFNHLTFIATYIIPLLAFQLDTTKDIVFLILLLSFIGVIYIKTNLYYLNPIFILFNISVFSATDKNNNECILMSKEKISSTEILHFTMLGDIYYVEKDK